ncbi:hypothetical protein EDB82DRAFT_496291 [Fusarium venenatum]|uniref:uncharacterized protein n=1 Tax=Fusarium venenatum TaxID=56646 RepID=UPI001E0DECF6|nr:hypothetical protein EDB82DRAFT_496291 [Fusarium venenatum]
MYRRASKHSNFVQQSSSGVLYMSILTVALRLSSACTDNAYRSFLSSLWLTGLGSLITAQYYYMTHMLGSFVSS